MLGPGDLIPAAPRRVLVAGTSGAGKTTLARRIASVVDAPHTEIDGLFHGPSWTPREEFAHDVTALVAGESWVTEWQYRAVLALLASRAELMVWLDPPFFTAVLPRLLRRTVRRRVRRERLWNGNVEPPFWTFATDRDHIVRWAIRTRRHTRERMSRVEADHPHLTVVRLRTASEVDAWLAGPLRAASSRQR